MAETFKELFQGQLPNAVATQATVPGGGVLSWIVKEITMINTDSSDITVALYRDGTVAANLMTPPAVLIVAGGMYQFTGSMEFATGATIAGVASIANKVNLIISGVELT